VVTGELLAELEAQDLRPQDLLGEQAHDAASGALALIRAIAARGVRVAGGFHTHVAHCKQLFVVLHQPETTALLTKEEAHFVRRHVPYTTRLDNRHIDLGAIKADKNNWIIKPEDGYASKGVFAGIDQTEEDWDEIIDSCSAKPYIVQTFCRQYATPNARLTPRDAQEQSEQDPDALALGPWNNLTGLYLYGGRFSGLFVRAGQKGIIAGFAGGLTVPVFLADYDPKAGLALHTKETQAYAKDTDTGSDDD
jgi:hypothetical protein